MYAVYFLLTFWLWNIQTKGKYPNSDLMKALIIIFLLLMFMKCARLERPLRFWHVLLQKLLTWSSSFKFLFIVIPGNTSFLFDSMEEPSITTVDGSLKLQRRWLLSLLTFIKFMLDHLKSSSDDVSNAFLTDSLFSFTVYFVKPFT